ncbi:MAG: Hsp20/alpha crystallin family protein [Deltaproteobacteria bacterium]|nr:Hsp20/alpha crystallin family protein [Deltaproteobacteria bacterium]
MKPMPDEILEKLLYFRQEIDKIFQEFFDQKTEPGTEGPGEPEVPVDIFDLGDEFLILAELPGIGKDDFILSAVRDTFFIEGEKKRRHPGEGSRFICAERDFGFFRRIIELPEAGNMTKVQARYSNGILAIRLPKIKERRGRKTRIEVE